MTYPPGPEYNPGEPATTPTPYQPTAPADPAPFAPVPTAPPVSATPAHYAPTQPTYEQPVSTPAYPTGAAPVAPPAPQQGFAQPVPMAPTYDPAMTQQYSAPPVSGPYGYAPMSGMPMTGMPMVAQPEKRGKGMTITLAVLTTFFLLVAGVMTTLFLQQRGEAQEANSRLTTVSKQYEEAKTKADSAQRDLDNTKRDLTDANEATTEMTNQKKVLGDCINAIYDFWQELDKSNGTQTTAVTKAGNNLDKKCNEADKFL